MENKTINAIDIRTLKTLIEAYTDVQKPKTQWQKGVYTLFDFLISEDMATMDNRVITDIQDLKNICLNGAKDWEHYSFGGSAWCYNSDIIEYFYTDKQKATYFYFPDGTCRNTRFYDNLLHVQARALKDAYRIIQNIYIYATQNPRYFIKFDKYHREIKYLTKSIDNCYISVSAAVNNYYYNIGKFERRRIGMKSNYNKLINNRY